MLGLQVLLFVKHFITTDHGMWPGFTANCISKAHYLDMCAQIIITSADLGSKLTYLEYLFHFVHFISCYPQIRITYS